MQNAGSGSDSIRRHEAAPDQGYEAELQPALQLPEAQVLALIKKIGDAEGKGGTWAITDNGMSFISGEIEMPKSVWTLEESPSGTQTKPFL